MRRTPGQFPVDGKVCTLLPTSEGFTLFADGFDVAHDLSPTWLSQSALDCGATEVRWAFDLKLAEGAPW